MNLVCFYQLHILSSEERGSIVGDDFLWNSKLANLQMMHSLEEIKDIITYKKPKNKNLDYIKDQNSVILEKIWKLHLEHIEDELKIVKKELAQIKYLIS